MKRFAWEVTVAIGVAIVLSVAVWLIEPLKPWWAVNWQWATPVLVLVACTIFLFLRLRALQQEIEDSKQRIESLEEDNRQLHTRMTGMGVPASELNQIQRKILSALLSYQQKYNVRKLSIARMSGLLHFDHSDNERPDLKGLKVDLTKEVYGSPSVDAEKGKEIFREIEAIPELYLKRYPDPSYWSPLVVCVIDAGETYLKAKSTPAG